jgi:hypothetical protein
MQMIGFSLPLRWPDADDERRAMEQQVLQMAAMVAGFPREFDAHLDRQDLRGRARFVEELLQHWPAGPEQPRVVAQLAARLVTSHRSEASTG